jgi:peptide/nickel transport system permease protein
LPLVCLTYGSLAALSRYMRTGLLDVIQADYIRTARAKGLEERVVIGKHAVRNGLLPILTLLAGLLPAILGGSVIVEYIFGIPGMGLWVVESINARDYNAIMAIQLVSTLLVLFGILLTDLSYAVVDPRIRYR